MFVFNSCNHGNDLISFPDHSFLHFPSPFDEDSSLLLQQPQHELSLHHLPLNEPAPSTFVNDLGSESTRIVASDDRVLHQNLIMEQQIQRKRSANSSKRDRHSKINTLRGPRDRRMRLSLPVAREFFGLQDMLGVDKASKTVEWLLFQARHAIKKLSRDQQSRHDGGDGDTRSPSPVSDGEVVSGIDETTLANNIKEDRKATKKEKRGRAARKTALFHPLARECREKARARARARTWEKQLQIREKMLSDANPIEQIDQTKQDLSKMSSSWSTQMETGEESGGITQIIDQQIRRRTQGIVIDNIDEQAADDCLMMMGRWSPSNSIYNSLQNNNGSPQEVSSKQQQT